MQIIIYFWLLIKSKFGWQHDCMFATYPLATLNVSGSFSPMCFFIIISSAKQRSLIKYRAKVGGSMTKRFVETEDSAAKMPHSCLNRMSISQMVGSQLLLPIFFVWVIFEWDFVSGLFHMTAELPEAPEMVDTARRQCLKKPICYLEKVRAWKLCEERQKKIISPGHLTVMNLKTSKNSKHFYEPKPGFL